jgi:hypothetical protein
LLTIIIIATLLALCFYYFRIYRFISFDLSFELCNF